MLARILEYIVARPWIYDRVQRMAGREENYRRLRPLLYRARGERLLDAGGGTGEIARIIDPSTRYVCIDNDEQKLSGFLSKGGWGMAIVADATRIPLKEDAVHTAVCVAVSHHLTDPELDRLLSELARVCRCQLIFLDALKEKTSLVSNLMWHYDRGRNPRTAEHLLSILRRHFAVEDIQRYKIYHHYLLCIGRPVLAAEEAQPAVLLESQS
jgi:ubiquinone/menaquinone biosynthesis C-methylase UbiE